ncbi:AAA family ATPase [Micromonospora sp. NPDC005979]|uniref:AAA family ATPase n=1 Tax=Micromonospora sp. NPDC005979 TaxID=3156726 RepID=UPI00339E4A4A
MTAVDLRGGPALTLVTGPPGVGRTHALRATADAAARDGARVLALRLAPEDRHEPWYLAGRILAALSPARGSGRVAEPPAAALTAALRRRSGLLLVLDDAQWADPESAEAIGDVLDDPAGSAMRCVAALRTGGGPAVPRPRPGMRARIVALRPQPAAEAEAIAARLLRATPHEDLAAALRRYGAGVPAAIDAVVAGYRDTGQLVVADGRAGLRDPGAVPVIPTGHQLLRPVRRLDRSARAVARALAVLQPFGPAAPALIGQALGLTPDEVDRQLAVVRTEGVTRARPGGWTVTPPALALALAADLGPYERHRTAQVAAEALGGDSSAVPDPHDLPDRLVEAGTWVDPGRPVAALARVRAGGRPARLSLADRCVLDFRAGRWTAALDGALLAEAAGQPGTDVPVARVAAEVLLAQGRPARARALLDAAADQPPHLLAAVRADLRRALGDPAAAAGVVRDALELSTGGELWVLAAELATEHGDPATARAARAATLPAYPAAVVRLIVDGDADAAAEAMEWTRRQERPYEVARTLERAVRWAGADPGLLAEAYDILGALGALLHRSRLRQFARHRGAPVAGRAETVAEGDLLLAVLVAEGLSNRELAAATQTSEKSVEGRLSRLFARTGYRSRVELATAVLAGTFPGQVDPVSAVPGR